MRPLIVIYRLGSLGDTVIALPCFHRIMAAFPDHERVALTNVPVSRKAPSLESILTPGGFIHGSIAYPVGLRGVEQLVTLGRRLRELKAETLIYLSFPRGLASLYRDLLFFRLCGIRRIIGAPLSPRVQGRPDPSTGEVEGEASRLARCLSALGPIDLEDRTNWDLRLTAQELAAARAALAPLRNHKFMAVNTGGKVPANDWGIENWSRFFTLLSERCALSVAFVGGPEDSARAKHLAAHWHGPTLDLCGRTSPRVASAILRDAELFVGHDSGPLHLAWTAGTPCVGLFGSNNPPGRWHPIGSQHVTLQIGTDVKHIRIGDVVEAVETVLRRRGAGAAVRPHLAHGCSRDVSG